MKIEFDKALLWLVPYLYLVSVMYYWGYWGTFDIDAFNYYSTSDLVKGIVSSLGSTLLLSIIVGIISLIMAYLLHQSFSKGLRYIFAMFVFAILMWLSLKIYYPNTYSIKNNDIIEKAHNNIQKISFWITIIPSILTLIIGYVYLPSISIVGNAVRASIIMFLMYAPLASYGKGYQAAWIIEQGFEFDYLASDSLAYNQKTIYKYLGKAGEYHVLLTTDNIKRIIVPASKLSPLVIERFLILDSASVSRFKAHQKEMAALVSKQPLQKQPTTTSPPQQPVQPK